MNSPNLYYAGRKDGIDDLRRELDELFKHGDPGIPTAIRVAAVRCHSRLLDERRCAMEAENFRQATCPNTDNMQL